MTDPSPAPRPRGRRGRYAKTSSTREAILRAALTVFARSGYRAGSVGAIAEMIGMTEAGISYHFPTKAALLEAVLELRNEQSRSMVARGDDGLEILDGIMRLIRNLPEVPGLAELYCVVSAEAINPEHPAHEHFVQQRRESRRILRRAFEDLSARGLLAPGVSAELAADVCASHVDGVQTQWLLEPDRIDMAAQVALLLRSFVPSWEPSAEAEAPTAADEAQVTGLRS